MSDFLDKIMTVALVKKLGGKVVFEERDMLEAMLILLSGEFEPYKEGETLVLQINESEEV